MLLLLLLLLVVVVVVVGVAIISVPSTSATGASLATGGLHTTPSDSRSSGAARV